MSLVKVTIDNPIAIVTLDVPPVHAVSIDMMELVIADG